ncbi:MAG TPA: glycosyltransferase family 87 protein [Vicinamibacterales bacterium]|nr:glycosyltransferase family 87 protein [Vicinamibacterales bacterium]
MSWLKWLAWPLLIASFAATIYIARIHTEMVDFEVYRQAAGRALHAENLYRPEDGHYQYKYLPAFAFAMAPFAVVQDRTARLGWYALSFGLLCAFLRWSAHAVPERRVRAGVLMAFAIVLVGRFYGRELNLGQSNILFGFTLMGALLAAEAGAERLAGVLVALGVFVKPYALILLPWLWLAAGASGVAAFAGVLLVGLALPALAYGWSGNLDQIAGWYRTVTDTSAPNLLAKENISFATGWAKWIGVGPMAERLAWITSVAELLLVAFAMSRRRRVREPAYLEFGLLMLVIPLVSPQGWDYVLLVATPAVMLLVDRWREMTMTWKVLTGAALVAIGFTIIDLLGKPIYNWTMGISLLTICASLLVAALVNLRVRTLG